MAQLVARDVWDVDAAGSNPVTPTISSVHSHFGCEHSNLNLVLICFAVLNFENLDPTKVLSLGLEIVKLIISLFELTGGNVMISTNIVVGIGFTIWGKPSNRVTVSKKKAIPRDEFGQCRSGFDPRPSTKLADLPAKPQSNNALWLFHFYVKENIV